MVVTRRYCAARRLEAKVAAEEEAMAHAAVECLEVAVTAKGTVEVVGMVEAEKAQVAVVMEVEAVVGQAEAEE